MRLLLQLLTGVLLAGCSSAPEHEPLMKRAATPGTEIMEDLEVVSLTVGSPGSIVLRNHRDTPRHIVWTARFRSPDGYEIKGSGRSVKEAVVPAKGELTLVLKPPVPEATQVEVLMGDR